MKLVVGLGNPGKRYEGTRHNVGFLGVDLLAERLHCDPWKESRHGKLFFAWSEVDGERVELIKPFTFMNASGVALAYAFQKNQNLRLDNLFVVHDDLDILLGKYKIQFGKGPRQHNGLHSIYERFGSKQFWHVRVGIENRIKNSKYRRQKISGEEYVLQRFPDEERVVLEPVMKNVLDELILRLHKSQ
ncbi:MAG: hypothetical protein A3A65_03380 [Candidatus Chisholmbacteria bacterium RIFCSPLOWO2_01_FULL_49_14]|uniref:Peptidyl-tRNA hydrolase n=1 Tax=Candidatus Chisholmbacteria bacterium RIFCSPLOWO2_01_FULL_49_14 TaxID=1797593 RepID=A0A1G1W138_9BACT|nr:MAG: hypothetical protein A3A65_03380 [Candidatus Chisholmbacteria bacterium RIFCSPLOWO2_01_FULL_49_14]